MKGRQGGRPPVGEAAADTRERSRRAREALESRGGKLVQVRLERGALADLEAVKAHHRLDTNAQAITLALAERAARIRK